MSQLAPLISDLALILICAGVMTLDLCRRNDSYI